MKQFKMLLLSSMVIFFTACGGGGGDTPTVTLDSSQQIAIDKIKAYADDNTQPVPTVEDYTDAGVVGVTVDNIDDINEVIAGLSSSDVDTTEEIQNITDDLGINIIDDSGINILPTANAGPDMSVEVNQKVTITGSGTDIDGMITSYVWTKNGNVVALTASFDYIPTTVGTDTLILTVMDDEGAIASDSMTVTVSEIPPQPPVWTATRINSGVTVVNYYDGTPKLIMDLTSVSYDPNGNSIIYSIDAIWAPSIYDNDEWARILYIQDGILLAKDMNVWIGAANDDATEGTVSVIVKATDIDGSSTATITFQYNSLFR